MQKSLQPIDRICAEFGSDRSIGSRVRASLASNICLNSLSKQAEYHSPGIKFITIICKKIILLEKFSILKCIIAFKIWCHRFFYIFTIMWKHVFLFTHDVFLHLSSKSHYCYTATPLTTCLNGESIVLCFVSEFIDLFSYS